MNVKQSIERLADVFRLKAGRSFQRRPTKEKHKPVPCPACRVTLNKDGHCYNRACSTLVAPPVVVAPSRERKGRGQVLEINEDIFLRRVHVLSPTEQQMLKAAYIETWNEPDPVPTGRSPEATVLHPSRCRRYRATPEILRLLTKVWSS